MGHPLPPIPSKRYFTIGEVSELSGVKPHVLRYWEQEFSQLRPIKRRGNRRYYQHHEVLMVRRIRELLYEQGFTISGARNQLQGGRGSGEEKTPLPSPHPPSAVQESVPTWGEPATATEPVVVPEPEAGRDWSHFFKNTGEVSVVDGDALTQALMGGSWRELREELLHIRKILSE